MKRRKLKDGVAKVCVWVVSLWISFIGTTIDNLSIESFTEYNKFLLIFTLFATPFACLLLADNSED